MLQNNQKFILFSAATVAHTTKLFKTEGLEKKINFLVQRKGLLSLYRTHVTF